MLGEKERFYILAQQISGKVNRTYTLASDFGHKKKKTLSVEVLGKL